MGQGIDGRAEHAQSSAVAVHMENSRIEMRLQELQHCISVAEQQLQVRGYRLPLLPFLPSFFPSFKGFLCGVWGQKHGLSEGLGLSQQGNVLLASSAHQL